MSYKKKAASAYRKANSKVQPRINAAADSIFGVFLRHEIERQRKAAGLARDRAAGKSLSREERQALNEAEGRARSRRRRS